MTLEENDLQDYLCRQLVEALGLSSEYFYDTNWDKLMELVRKQTRTLIELRVLLDKFENT